MWCLLHVGAYWSCWAWLLTTSSWLSSCFVLDFGRELWAQIGSIRWWSSRSNCGAPSHLKCQCTWECSRKRALPWHAFFNDYYVFAMSKKHRYMASVGAVYCSTDDRTTRFIHGQSTGLHVWWLTSYDMVLTPPWLPTWWGLKDLSHITPWTCPMLLYGLVSYYLMV